MAGYNDSEGPYTPGAPGFFTHLTHITDITNKFDKDATPATGDVPSWDGTVYVPQTPSGATAVGDRILYVSKSGNDSNNGRSWGKAFLTVGAAMTALGANAGTIYVGAGTYDETTISPTGDQTITGAGRYATTLRLASTGTLIDLSSDNNFNLKNVGLAFASSSVTGTLLKLSNTFNCSFYDVRFSGTTTAAQVGVELSSNTGDNSFIRCRWEALAVGVQVNSETNVIDNSSFSACTVAVQGGDAAGSAFAAGIMITHSVFKGAGTHYINITGTAAAWFIDKCWFDGGATTAVQVGTGTFGPRFFALTNIPSLYGATTSLVLNAADRTVLDNIRWHHGGTTPTELSIPTPTNVTRGRIGLYRSSQSTKIETLVPEKWEGWRGYFTYDSNKTQGTQSNTFMDVGTGKTFRRIVIRIAGRLSGDPQTVITFPAAFEMGERYITFNNTSFTGVVLAAATLTIPTANAGSGLIIIEGW